MKKTLFFLFVANLFFSQNPDLTSTNWQVTQYISEQFPNPQVPPPMPYQQVTNFISNPSKLNLAFFNNVSADVTYNGENTFTIHNKTCTSANYSGDTGQVNQFFGLLCSFFYNDGFYYYSIENDGNTKTLKIGNGLFQEIHFKSLQLNTKETSEQKIIIYPNPTKDIIKIENLKPNSSLELMDNTGKLVKTIFNSKSTKTEIDMKSLAPGIYYLKVDGQSVQKIIKK